MVEDRKARAEDEPALRCRTCAHRAAVDLDAFADTDKTVPEAVALRTAPAVVPYLDLQLVRPITDGHVGVAGMCMLQCVRQAFLDDAISREVNPPREREGLFLGSAPQVANRVGRRTRTLFTSGLDRETADVARRSQLRAASGRLSAAFARRPVGIHGCRVGTI